jgi:hypothetical protein
MSNDAKEPAPDGGLQTTSLSASSYVESGKHLPEFMRDFHDQKDLFKAIHHTYAKDDPEAKMPDWRQAHCYTVDWFLWFMGLRGYTLQKSRAKVDFRPLRNTDSTTTI